VSGLPAQSGGRRRKRGCDVTDIWDIRAVLLDMDGTLLDTERVYFDSLVTALGAFGYTDDVETLCHAMVGLPARSAMPCCTRAMAKTFHWLTSTRSSLHGATGCSRPACR
jgi:hypothetical protein